MLSSQGPRRHKATIRQMLCRYAAIKVLVKVYFNCASQHRHPGLIENDVFQSIVYHSADYPLSTKDGCAEGLLNCFFEYVLDFHNHVFDLKLDFIDYYLLLSGLIGVTGRFWSWTVFHLLFLNSWKLHFASLGFLTFTTVSQVLAELVSPFQGRDNHCSSALGTASLIERCILNWSSKTQAWEQTQRW